MPVSCDLMDCSPPGSFVDRILQARVLVELSSPSTGDLPNAGSTYHSLALQADSLPSEPPAATAAKSLQSCTTLCDPIDGSPPGSPVPGILKARTLDWVAILFNA